MGQVLFTVGIVAVAIASDYRGDRNCRRIISDWAAERGCELRMVRRRWFTLRFFLRSRSQRVFDVEVVDDSGVTRRASLLVGGFFAGSRSATVREVWHRDP